MGDGNNNLASMPLSLIANSPAITGSANNVSPQMLRNQVHGMVHGIMAAGLGNPTDVPSKASTRRSKTWLWKPQLSVETLMENMTHLV
jgi:hypothetical protein